MASKKIFQIDAFTDKPFEGNPAAVTFGDDLSRDEMQKIAREMNLSETAFISKSSSSDFKLQWFTPKNEVKLCGHGTIASLHFLNENNFLVKDEITFETLSGILKCRFNGGKYFMQMPDYKIYGYNENKEAVVSALGLERKNLNETPFILLENGNLYIHVSSISVLKNTAPDFKSLKNINGIEGVVLFTRETIDEGNDAHTRYFTPWHGIDEDPVTGSANGPLLPVLQHLGFIKADGDVNVIFEQGDFLNRRGRVGVSFFTGTNELYISGNAVTVLRGEITL